MTAVILLLLAAGIRGEASAPADFAAVLEKLRIANHIPGLSAVVVRDGRVVFQRGFGYANLERRVRATPDTPYNIASVTKPLSAVVALKLGEEGKLDLDRKLETNREFAEFCEEFGRQDSIFSHDLRCGELTLRHVLSHTVSGPPGQRFSYNPVMYSMASRPIAAAGGKPFSTLIDELVFRPAGMKRSARKHRDLPLRADLSRDLAPPYHVDERGRLVPAPAPGPQGDGAAGGVVSTALDLAKFDVALDAGKLVSDKSRQSMMTPARTASGAALPYGLGFFVQEHGGRKLAWHSGWWEKAYSAIYLKIPEERLTLILLANSEGLWWNNPLDSAQIEKSPFAAAFLDRFLGSRGR